MSLFPAYGQGTAGLSHESLDDVEKKNSAALLAMEMQLLASDSEVESEAEAQQAPAGLAGRGTNHDYYVDDRLDCGNLRVSTLYFPGRPQYSYRKRRAIGLSGGRGEGRRAGSVARYYTVGAAGAVGADEAGERAEYAERARALRRLLDDQPLRPALWLTLIDLHEGCGEAEAALAAAEQGAARLPASRPLREARQRLRRAHLSIDQTIERLRDDLAKESGTAARRQCWAWLVEAAGVRGGVDASGAAAAAALAGGGGGGRGGRGGDPLLYPALVLAHGEVARAAGLHEHLVLLVELLAAMCFPRTPAALALAALAVVDPATELQRDALLHRKEDELIASGLPLGVVWARVERARAAAHWRPAAGGAGGAAAAGGDADPQRAPAPADVADLLLPVRDTSASFLLAVNMLRLAKVPLMGGAASALGDRGGWGAGGGGGAECGERVLALVRAARLLPPRHPARPAPLLARQALALLVDPPHYFTDDAGYLSWVNSLWEACCSWFEGERRSALVCWRLRWLHALALALDVEGEGRAEAGRLRAAARALLKGHPAGDPLPYAQLARLLGALGQPAAAARTAWGALGAALRDPHVPAHHRLYIARVVRELGGAHSPEGAWALCSAALGRDLPPAGGRDLAPPEDLRRLAYQTCLSRCAALERQWEAEADISLSTEEEEEETAAEGMLPGAAEWGVARALLAPAADLPALRRALLQDHDRHSEWGAQAARYWAGTAAAVATRLRGREWRTLARLHPGHALLALGSSGAPLGAGPGASARGRPPARDGGAALAPLLPPLYGALAAGWRAREASRLVAAGARAARPGGAGCGAAGWAARLEAEARAERPRCERAAVAALSALPHCKWLYVRAAQWAPDAAALADLLLPGRMRLHTLFDELHPVSAPPAPPPPDTTENVLDMEQ